MTNAPLMPKATAVWLLDNTALTFDQVADFTKMHPLEIRAIADGDAAQGIKGSDPISNGQLTREEIERGEKDPNHRLKLEESKVVLPPAAKKKGPRYTPVSRRHERPSAILWLVRNHPELKDAQIMRLVGTTKTTIASVRDRTHWNASTLTPMDPVTLGLCSQIELDFEVQRAAKEKPVDQQYGGATLLRRVALAFVKRCPVVMDPGSRSQALACPGRQLRDITPHSRDTLASGLCIILVPLKAEGAGNAGRWPHP
jgi:hypothetical protein